MQAMLPITVSALSDPFSEREYTPAGLVAVDANPYSIRLVHCYVDGTVLDTLETKPHHLARVVNWVRAKKRYFPELQITGDRADRWPPGLLPALVQEFGPICWAPGPLLKQTTRDYQRLGKVLKFVRAALIAACAQEGYALRQPDAQAALTMWRRAVLKDISVSLSPKPDDDVLF